MDTAAHRSTVHLGKGQRDRLAPLTETPAHWLTRYVTAARPELAAGKWWVKGRRRGTLWVEYQSPVSESDICGCVLLDSTSVMPGSREAL